MSTSDYTFQIGDLAIIHEVKPKQFKIDLSRDQNGKMDSEMVIEADHTTFEGEPILVEPNDFILLPALMMTIKVAPKRAIGKAFQIPGYLIKFPSSIVTKFGVRYIRYKLTIEMHRYMLETHQFAFKAGMTLEQILNMRLSLVEEEAKLVNADASGYMKKIEEATAKAIFAHKRVIEQWKAAMKILTLNDQHWH